jgi:serine phosphatase RsbU (regulator of sigma subunit)/DNA-binding NarL/FixJ family response regulator
MPIRIAIVDDQPIIRSGLSAFIRSADNLLLVGEAADGEEALQLCELVKPDVVVMDIKMPVMDGMTASRTIHQRWPEIQIVLLSSYVEKGLAQSALEAGASGYLIKDITAEELIAAIQKIRQERLVITPKTLASHDPLEVIERIGQALLSEQIDASRLVGLLRRHLPTILPGCQIEVHTFPDREFLTFPAEGLHHLSQYGWSWLQSQTSLRVVHSGNWLPWAKQETCENDLILSPVLAEGGNLLGGLAVWNADTGEEPGGLLTVVEALSQQLARGMSLLQGKASRPAHQNMAQQLAAAAKIQSDLLPARMPDLPGWEFAARLEPAMETSGDFYDLIALHNNHWGLVIADVSDKGMGAALFMALSSTLIRTYAKQYPTLPALSISTVNERILSDSRSGMFVTAFYAVLEPNTGRLRYVNAGHNPPILISSQKGKKVDRLQSTGMALGVMGEIIWKQKVTRLLPGDVLVMYTDGVTDAQDRHGEFYGEQRLLQVIRRCNCPAQETLETILEDVDRFTGGTPQADDITLLVARRTN